MTKSIRSSGLLALGNSILDYRTAKGWSQRDLARETGLRQSFIAKLEKGLRRVDVVELVVIARLLDIPPAELLSKVEIATPRDHTISGQRIS
ncbi:helix-turn-helix domain-containing protein [Roseovarius pacificus]|uniref:helix-turn-helix domain-containing protein n=1 Tax=Roseovarius pacificus TaxID=337701 RepID=UPI000933D609|nr:helix-turn-helix transcriptional regulator [Roseovarius pacificus]